nr:reverse transcriptase domain-containing protein [Tanacetum cinerariifolium]
METEEELLDPWTLFTDRSSCIDGSRAGLMLTNPKGAEFTYALRFRFNGTNNEAEYKALTAGLIITEQMVIQAEIGMPTLRTTKIDMVDEALEINLDLLEERREQAAIHEERNKAKMETYYNSKVRNTSFKPRDLVYRNNDASHAKGSRKWEGPYEVTKALGNRAYKLRDRNGKLLS